MNALNARVFVERLHLDSSIPHHVVPCPFHDDHDASFSVDLEKGVYYCFGGCTEPKGGGTIGFLIKWAKIKEGRTITRKEASAMLRRILPAQSAQAFRREIAHAEILLFARVMAPVYADRVRAIEDKIRRLDALVAQIGGRLSSKDSLWSLYADLYRQRSTVEWQWSVCQTSRGKMSLLLARLFRDAKANDDWHVGRVATAHANRDARQRARQLLTRRENDECRLERPSRPTRTAVPVRTPVLVRTPILPETKSKAPSSTRTSTKS